MTGKGVACEALANNAIPGASLGAAGETKKED